MKLKKMGKNFDWIRPCYCRKCKSKIWGHGFIYRFFNAIKNAIPIKRWICSVCGIVYVCIPLGYWSRYQESISNIYEYLLYRVKHQKWPPEVRRQRAGHWLSKLLVNAKLYNLMKDSVLATIFFYKDKNLSIN